MMSLPHTKRGVEELVGDSEAEVLERIFTEFDQMMDGDGMQSMPANARYLYVRLLQGMDPNHVHRSEVLSRLPPGDQDDLVDLLGDSDVAATFADVARFVVAAAVDSPGFTSFHPVQPLEDAPRVLMVGSYREKPTGTDVFLTPPAGIHRIACFLRLFGFPVEVTDPVLDGTGPLMEKAAGGSFDIGMFALLQPTIFNGIELMQKVQEIAAPKDILFVLGGQGVTFDPELLLKKTPAHIVCPGMGEFPCLDIAAQYSSGKEVNSFQNISGLYLHRQETNSMVFTGRVRPYRQRDLRAVSFAIDFGALPYRDYWDYNRRQYRDVDLERIHSKGMGYNTIRVYTELYCPHNCSFCVGTTFFRDIVEGAQPTVGLSAEDIGRILSQAADRYPELETVFFNSDNFLLDRRKVYEVCRVVEQEFDGDLSFAALARVDAVDPIVLERMREVGFEMVFFGVESTSEDVLNDIGKGLRLLSDARYAEEALEIAKTSEHPVSEATMDQLRNYLNNRGQKAKVEPGHVVKRSIRDALGVGLNVSASIIFFYPKAEMDDLVQTMEDVLELIAFGATIDANRYAQAYEGTRISERGYETVSNRQKLAGQIVSVPEHVRPMDGRVRRLASRMCDPAFMESVEDAFRTCYEYEGKWTRTLDALAFLWGFCFWADIPRTKVERVVETTMARLGCYPRGEDINLSLRGDPVHAEEL